MTPAPASLTMRYAVQHVVLCHTGLLLHVTLVDDERARLGSQRIVERHQHHGIAVAALFQDEVLK